MQFGFMPERGTIDAVFILRIIHEEYHHHEEYYHHEEYHHHEEYYQ